MAVTDKEPADEDEDNGNSFDSLDKENMPPADDNEFRWFCCDMEDLLKQNDPTLDKAACKLSKPTSDIVPLEILTFIQQWLLSFKPAISTQVELTATAINAGKEYEFKLQSPLGAKMVRIMGSRRCAREDH